MGLVQNVPARCSEGPLCRGSAWVRARDRTLGIVALGNTMLELYKIRDYEVKLQDLI